MKNNSITTRDGIKLVGIWTIPLKETNKAIILAHGITVDKDEHGVFVNLAKKLSEAGYAVFRFDFRGHGESGGNSVDMTIGGEIEDLYAVINYAKSQGYSNIGLLGASFGGGTSVVYTSKYQEELRCLCLWNPVLNYDHCFLNPTLPWIREKKKHMKGEIDKQGWTTLGSRKYKVGKLLFDEMVNIKPFELMSKIKIPSIVIHGTADTKVPFEDSKEYLEEKLVSIEGAEHGFHENWEYQRAEKITIDFFKKYL